MDIGSGRVGLLVLSSARVEVIVQRNRQQVSLGGRFGRERSSPAQSQWWVQGFHSHCDREAGSKCWGCPWSPLWSCVKE